MTLASVSPLDSANGSASATGAVSSNAGGGLGLKNEFLQMMVAQINNQDPMDPLDGTQYVTQLAQFSMVEGVEGLRVQQQQAASSLDSLQVLQSTNLVGQTVLAPAREIRLAQPEVLQGQLVLSEPAERIGLAVYDSAGNLVARRAWGASGSGRLDFALPELPAGEYRLAVEASQAGVASQPAVYLAQPVERVSLPGDGSIALTVAGIGEVPLFSITEFGKRQAQGAGHDL